MKKKIIIVSGEPNSVNSEIIYKSWKKINKNLKRKIFLVSNYNLLKSQFKKLNYSIELQKVNYEDKISSNKLKVIDVNLNFKDPFKISKKSVSKYILNSLNLAHKLAINKDVGGLINCAIDKKSLNKNKIGVTEYLSSKCKVINNSEVMLIFNKKLSISPLTTHIDIKDIKKKLNSKIIITKISTINKWFYEKFKKKPKFAVLGLNPHNSEFRKESEEKKIIIPAINKLKKRGMKIEGPFSSDSFFIQNFKNFNIIVGMYHDQILTPYKAIFKFDAINVTLGLKYLRVSPDHGTAVNLIKKNKADSSSLLSCIYFVNKFSK